MPSVLIFALPTVCGAAILFSGYKRRAKHQRQLSRLRAALKFDELRPQPRQRR